MNIYCLGTLNRHTAMTIDQFWKIIEGIDPPSNDMDRKCAALKKHLESLAPGEVVQFADHYWTCRARSYQWPLWDAADLMYSGCGDDAFMDFQSSLITFGRDVFESALANPDTLADLPARVPLYQGVYGVIHDAIHRASAPEYRPATIQPREPTGATVEDEDDYERAVQLRFPKLAARYLQTEEKTKQPKRPWWKLW